MNEMAFIKNIICVLFTFKTFDGFLSYKKKLKKTRVDFLKIVYFLFYWAFLLVVISLVISEL